MIRRILTMCVLLLLVAGVQASNVNGHFFKSLKKQVVMVSDVENYFSQWFSLPAETEWREVSHKTDRLGMERIEFRQYVAGVEVEHSQVLIHAKDGRVITANGTVMEKKQTPAKLRKAQLVYKNGTPTDLLGRTLYLVDTPSGYRYAVKVLSADGLYWIYYDAENGTELKRITTVRHLTADDYVPATATGRSLYSGDVTLDVTQSVDGVTFLHDQQRNIQTRVAGYIPGINQLLAEGKLYDYYPQLDLPDDPNQATQEQINEWIAAITIMGNEGRLPLWEKQIVDFAPFVNNPTNHYEAYRITKLNLESVLAPDAEGTLQPLQPSEENPILLGIEILYSGNPQAISKCRIEDVTNEFSAMPIEIGLDGLIEVLPREGVTFVVKRYHITKAEIAEQQISDLSPYAEVLGYATFIPSDSETHAELQNDVLRLSLDYEKYGDPVVDIHWGMARTLDFYKEKFDRNSYDDQGSPVYNLVYVHEGTDTFLKGSRNNAAAIQNPPYPMVYGMGGAVGSRFVLNPLVELSVMSHEFTHVITCATADLVYQGESGALNESFSDLMGVSVKKYVQGNDASWTVGDGVMIGTSNMRDMAHPWLSCDGQSPQPGFYKDANWFDTESAVDHGGVHTNSGVQNRWYYLLTDGEEGVDAKGLAYNITGIGIDKSQQIAYRTLTEYATRQSQYADIRPASLQAAEDLYGENSVEVQTVAAAWNAVGVYEDGETTALTLVNSEERTVNNEYFDLQGRKVANPTKGLYIVNGRKVVVK